MGFTIRYYYRRQGEGMHGGPRNPNREDRNTKQDFLGGFEEKPGGILPESIGMVE
ncbi:hypothetical protein [Leptospira biflexa]|uniref:hypothetical protein n=1 Tax=Leptospira biflexa TaxID=172 RepID=UPI001FF03C95|nr:hypothetical protein [Leptospira biflexa]